MLEYFARRHPKLEVRVFEGSDQEVESWLRERPARWLEVRDVPGSLSPSVVHAVDEYA